MWKKVFFPSACWPGPTQHQSNAQASVVERVGAKGGQDHVAQPAVDTHHGQILDYATYKKQEWRCFLHPSGCEGCFWALKPRKICTSIYPSALFAMSSLSWALIWRPNPLNLPHGLLCIPHFLCGSRWLKSWSRHCQTFLEPSWASSPAYSTLWESGQPVSPSTHGLFLQLLHASLLSQVCATQLAILSHMCLN